jgi:hypothetical protein
LLLVISAWFLLQTSPVQNWLVKKVTARLSKGLNTTVKINHINIAFFNKLLMEGTLVKDKSGDTLLYTKKLTVNVTDWFFLKDNIGIQYAGLEDARVYLHRTDAVWNYQFLIDYFSTPSTGKKQKAIQLDFKKIDIKNMTLLQEDEWRGENQALALRSLYVDAENFDLQKKNIAINSIEINEPVFSIYNYPGLRPKRPAAVKDTANKDQLEWNPANWVMLVKQMEIKNGAFKSDVKTEREPYYYFDGRHVSFSAINAKFANLRLNKDTLRATVQMSTKERSGFVVNNMQAVVAFNPHAMEFANLNIETPKSRLQNYFAMRYNEFSDMSDFIELVTMQGNFKNAVIHSDDIACFAPELKNLNLTVAANGNLKGTVSNLHGRNLNLVTGKNTLLSGDIDITGLPDVNKTYIQFKATDFKTTYNDAVALFPAIKKIQEPNISSLQTIRFKGYFTGLVRDFVTYGTIETNLGTLVTDVNMKLPAGGTPTYAGKISTQAFNLGNFLNNKNLGIIAFNGLVQGSNFNIQQMQATLNGKVSRIDFKKYTYHNIAVKGTVARRLFNGNISINDENLVAQLNGLVDTRSKTPLFNFTAHINKGNTQKLKLTSQDIDFTGDLDLNFSGNNIDDFYGNAKILNASVFKSGKRISFDSLTLSSQMVGNSKTIVLQSNEFDAAIAGKYKILDLPAAFQTYLNRYYPSYINPSSKKIAANNFNFIINTKNVDDYLDLIDNRLTGFNNSSISGQINSETSRFDINAEVPKFAYKNIAFTGVRLEGKGNLDSLKMNMQVEDVFVNDSLHFPVTSINLAVANDLSDVSISTSASQALNSAEVHAQVQTLRNGVRILFKPSVFDVNGKRWAIDKDGELILSRELVTTDGIRIHSDDQEIFVTSKPSEIGTTNDINVELKKINIGDFAPFFVKDNRLEGLLTGTIDISDPFGKMSVTADGRAEQFRLDDDSLGMLQLNTTYQKSNGSVNFKAASDNDQYNFDLNGIFKNIDSSRQQLDITTNLRNTNINLLQRYLSGIFAKVEGRATGQLRIVGSPKNLSYLGDIDLKDGGLLVNYTRCYYKIPTAKISLQEGEINFGSFIIKDTLNNTGQVQNGVLYHQSFKNMAFDFKLKTDKLLLLNTKPASENKQFYGSMIGRATVNFYGPMDDMTMDIKGEPTDSSKIYLPMGSSKAGEDGDYLVWKVYGREMKDYSPLSSETNLTVSLDITANNYAKVYLILDELTDDIIEATGRGNIKMKAGTREQLTMSGRYEIDRGYYNFNFQNWKRKFQLLPEAGNSISWNGDPYQANLNIDAVYEAENVRFSDLISGNEAQFGQVSDNVKKYRGKVQVVAKITERLSAPQIAFEIRLPDNSPVRNEPGVLTLLQLIERDDNELNKQVSFLILFNSFGPLNTGRNTNAGNVANTAFEGLVVNSISGALSSVLTREVSNVLQNIFRDKSIKVNINASLYNGTNLLTAGQSANYNNQVLPDRTNLNFSISKNFFNERLTFVVGSALDFGLNSQQSQAAFQFLPDVTAEYKLTPEGKFLLTFFYRNNYSYITNGPLSRSGGSISYRREFDKLNELFGKKKPASRN